MGKAAGSNRALFGVIIAMFMVEPFFLSFNVITLQNLTATRCNGIECHFLLSELQALAELLGAYGMKYLGQKMMQQVASQVGEIKVQLLTPYTLISV